jgi:hypothetical protein
MAAHRSLDTERIVDLVDPALHRGYPPPGWPARLSDAGHANTLTNLTVLTEAASWPSLG